MSVGVGRGLSPLVSFLPRRERPLLAGNLLRRFDSEAGEDEAGRNAGSHGISGEIIEIDDGIGPIQKNKTLA